LHRSAPVDSSHNRQSLSAFSHLRSPNRRVTPQNDAVCSELAEKTPLWELFAFWRHYRYRSI
jgi:hypothetical protein